MKIHCLRKYADRYMERRDFVKTANRRSPVRLCRSPFFLLPCPVKANHPAVIAEFTDRLLNPSFLV
jgi:hypothetical protein